MKHYVLIESRDPFEDGDSEWYRRLASELHRSGHDVAVFLVENGVFAAQRRSKTLDALKTAGVVILADEFALSERGIGRNELAPGIAAAPLDTIIERMAGGASVMWR